MTETEVAKRLNVCLASVCRRRLERQGTAFVKVGTLVRYRPEDLDTWLSELPIGGSIRTVHNGQQTPCALRNQKSTRRYLEIAVG